MGYWGFFSDREEDILKIIGNKKTMTLRKISQDLFFHVHRNDQPFDAVISVGNSVRRIIKKCEYHGLNWTLVRKRVDGKMYITKGKL